MAKYNQLSYGSKGSDVTELQKLLNATGNGYNLAEDGDFGEKTRAAVEDYQSKNGLKVDGIVGDNTWGSITGFKPGATATTMGTSTGSSGGTAQANSFNYGNYEASDAVKQAEAMLQEQMNNKPGEYQSTWQAQLDEIMGQILNRQPFEYDLNGDALYQQYKDQAVQQGRMAMMDTMGQAAALTGGYGSSYAQSVGQQAYQNHLQGLNDVVPELYQLALDKYAQDGQNLLDQYAMVGAREDQDYGRYRDSLSDYNSELDRLLSQYYTERDYDYGRYTDERDFAYGQYSDDRAYAYQEERDRIADEQWQKEFDEAKRQYDQSYALSASKSSGSGSGSSSRKSSGSSSGTNNQQQSGTMTDYQKTEAMLINGGYNSAQMLQIIRSSPLSREEQDALIAQYQKPLQKQEVEEAANKRKNDNSAYWGSR